MAADFDLRVAADAGIESIRVRDAHDFPVSGVPVLEGCPELVEVVLAGLSTYRLPLSVDVMECGSDDLQTLGPLFGTGGPGPESEARPLCSPLFMSPPSAECVAAAARAREAREAARDQCDRNADLKDERDRHRDWATRLWIAAGAALALAVALVSSSWVGAIIAVVLFAAAAALTYAAIVAFGLAQRWDERLAQGRERFRELRVAFDDARDRAARFCCPGDGLYDASDLECGT